MNKKEFNKYVNEINKKIFNKINDEEKELFNSILELANEMAIKKCMLENALDEIENWLKETSERMDTFSITQRKETGAFWFGVRGNMDNLLEIIKKAKRE